MKVPAITCRPCQHSHIPAPLLCQSWLSIRHKLRCRHGTVLVRAHAGDWTTWWDKVKDTLFDANRNHNTWPTLSLPTDIPHVHTLARIDIGHYARRMTCLGKEMIEFEWWRYLPLPAITCHYLPSPAITCHWFSIPKSRSLHTRLYTSFDALYIVCNYESYCMMWTSVINKISWV
jgi:hypothetical protein